MHAPCIQQVGTRAGSVLTVDNAFLSAPASSSSLTTSTCPAPAAQCSGIVPSYTSNTAGQYAGKTPPRLCLSAARFQPPAAVYLRNIRSTMWMVPAHHSATRTRAHTVSTSAIPSSHSLHRAAPRPPAAPAQPPDCRANRRNAAASPRPVRITEQAGDRAGAAALPTAR